MNDMNQLCICILLKSDCHTRQTIEELITVSSFVRYIKHLYIVENYDYLKRQISSGSESYENVCGLVTRF